MTTLRDAMAYFIADYWYGDVSPETVLKDADAYLEAIDNFPEPVRQELAALLDPWRPIETAPKDGSAFLAYGIHTTSPPDAQRGVKPGDNWWAIILYDVWRKRADGGDCWVFAKDGKYTWSEPTHWLPLPAPPSEDK